MEENQLDTNQEIKRESAPDVFKKMPERKSKLPLINTVLSVITLFVTLVILVVVIMSSLRGPTMMGGGNRIEGMPQGTPIPIGQQSGGENIEE